MFKESEPTLSDKIATKMLSGIVFLLISLFILVAATPGIVEAEETGLDEGWQFTVEPYMWAASISVPTASGTDVDIDFDDIMDNLDMTFMGVFGVRKGKWSILTDVIYLDLEDDDSSSSAAVPVGPRGRSSVSVDVDADVELSSWILTPAVGYAAVLNEQVKLDVVAGARYLYLKADTKLDISEELDSELLRRNIVRTGQVNDRIIESDDVWDGIVGIRGQVNLNEKWYLPFYADVGTGDSDLTWQAAGGVGYRFSKVDVIAGYRYIAWEFDDDAAFDDMDVSGPYAGVKFVF